MKSMPSTAVNEVETFDEVLSLDTRHASEEHLAGMDRNPAQ